MRWLALLLIAPVVACVPMQEETRIERGPLLRSYERQTALGNKTLQAQFRPAYPNLEIFISRVDTCRTEKVDEYAEDNITERSSRGVGPALTLGICGTLAGGGVLLARNAFSNDPNRDVIDASGHYGASPRQIATAWSTGAVIVGIPALAVAIIDMARSGETVETQKAEQVVSSRDAPCSPEVANGTLEMLAGPGPRAYPTKDGKVVLTADQVKELGELTMNLDGEPVFIAPQEDEKLNAFRACTQALPIPSEEELASLSAGPLETRIDLLTACERVSPEAAAEGLKVYNAALTKVMEAERPSSSIPGPRIESWDEVITMDAPNRRIAEGTADTVALLRDELPSGETVTLVGRVRTRANATFAILQKDQDVSLVLLRGKDEAAENEIRTKAVDVREYELAIVTVGNNDVAVILSPGSVWDAAVRGGAVLEFAGQVWKTREVDGTPLPLIEAHWARSATQ